MTPAVVITISLVLILLTKLLSVRFFGYAEVIGGNIKGFCFVLIIFASVVVAAAESANPHHVIPKAAKHVNFCTIFVNVTGAFFIGIIIDPLNPILVSGSGDANSSPFAIAIAIAIRETGIKVFPSFINACILVST